MEPPPPSGEPTQRTSATVFVDAQNLFYAVRQAFGYDYPNYDALALAEVVRKEHGWRLKQHRFYTGVPSPRDNHFCN